MANHRRDEGGKEWAKATTISLLKRLAWVTGLTKKQIECDLGIAVANTDKDRCTLPTGDAVVKALNSKRSAFSLQRLSSIVGSAYERGWLDDRDLHDLRLVDASIGADPAARHDAHTKAYHLFLDGVERLSRGHTPLAPGGAKGGRPSKPKDGAQACENYNRWIDAIRVLGGAVYEDRWTRFEDELQLEPQSREEVDGWDYGLLPEADRPLDPWRPHPKAISRLRLVFPGGFDRPVLPHPIPERRFDETNGAYSATLVDEMTDTELDEIFVSIERAITEAAARATGPQARESIEPRPSLTVVPSGAKPAHCLTGG